MTNNDASNWVQNQWLARCSGGVYFYSDGAMTTGVHLVAGAGSWSSVSDRNLKENFAPVDGAKILNILASIPIQTWNYKTQDKSIRHIGPMAQDFAKFGVGEDDKSITTLDADGVALAAIQELYRQNQEILKRNEELKKEIEELEQEIEKLK